MSTSGLPPAMNSEEAKDEEEKEEGEKSMNSEEAKDEEEKEEGEKSTNSEEAKDEGENEEGVRSMNSEEAKDEDEKEEGEKSMNSEEAKDEEEKEEGVKSMNSEEAKDEEEKEEGEKSTTNARILKKTARAKVVEKRYLEHTEWEPRTTMAGEVPSEGYTAQTTSWDRAVASPVPDSSGGSSDVDRAAAQGKIAADEAKKKSSEARAEVREAPLPQGWEQIITAAGKVYYVNHITKDARWRRPGTSPVGKSSGVDTAAATYSEEWRPLPLGWEQGRTPSGEVYYIDHNTKTTTWERPVASSIEDYSSTASPSVASPQRWEQGRTPSGEVYYINRNTKTTTWERPVASPVEDYSSATISVTSPQRWEQGPFRPQYFIDDNTETTTWDWSVASSIEDYSSATPSVASPQLPLPEGWEAKPGPDGQTVYINHAAKTTQWERPTVEQPTLGPSGNESSDNLPEGWEAKPGPVGRTVYINHTKRTTQWERPTVKPPSPVPSSTEGSESLPEGWEQKMAASGEIYYVNDRTKTTTWERPIRPTADVTDIRIISPLHPASTVTTLRGSSTVDNPPSIGVRSSTKSQKGASTEAVDDRPPYGRKQKTTAEGEVFYVNHSTKTTSWDRPVVSPVQDSTHASTSAPAPSAVSPSVVASGRRSPLPAGWEQGRTPSGEVFYIDHNTKTTTWERPAASPVENHSSTTISVTSPQHNPSSTTSAAGEKGENAEENDPAEGVNEPLPEGGHVDAKQQARIMKEEHVQEHSQLPKHSLKEAKAGNPFSEQPISEESDGPRMFEEKEAVLAERLGTQAATFSNSSFGVELILEETSLEQNINAKVVVKSEIRLVKCSRQRDTSRTHDEMLAQGLEHGFGELDESLDLLAMPIVYGPSEAKFNDDRPARLRFFAGYMEELQNDIQGESEDDFCRNKMEEYLRKEYEPLISPNGENWRMLPPFNVVFKNYNGRTTEVWLETRLYHFSMGSIGKVLRKQPDFRFFEGFMPWRMRFFGRRHEVIFGNATEDDLVYYACKKIDVVANRRRNEVEAGYLGAYGKVAIEDDISMVNHGIDHVMKHKVDSGTYRTVEMFKDGNTVQDQMMFAVFLPKAASLIFLEKDLLSKRKMYVVLPKMIARWRDGAEPTDEEKLRRTATITEVKTFLGKY